MEAAYRGSLDIFNYGNLLRLSRAFAISQWVLYIDEPQAIKFENG
jgi:hypothetical protein